MRDKNQLHNCMKQSRCNLRVIQTFVNPKILVAWIILEQESSHSVCAGIVLHAVYIYSENALFSHYRRCLPEVIGKGYKIRNL